MGRLFVDLLRGVGKTLPVLFDLAGISLVTWGVWLLEGGLAGWWSVVAGAGCFLAGLRISKP